MGSYFVDTDANAPNSTEITMINENENKQAFRSKLLNAPSLEGEAGENYYIGQMMSSLVDLGDASLLKEQYNKAFPLPKPDSFGVCNNFKSAHFMMDDKSSCT